MAGPAAPKILAAFAAIAIAVTLIAPVAWAQNSGQTIRLPITIDYAILGAALKQQIFTDKGRLDLLNSPGQCQYLYAEHPVFSPAGEQLKLETDGVLSLGLQVGEKCLSPISWNGIIQAEAAPFISGHFLKLRVTDIDVLDRNRKKTLIAGHGFDLIKQYFIPRLETFQFDLDPATDELVRLAEAASPPAAVQRVRATLDSLRVLPEVTPVENGLRTTLVFTLPVMPASAATPAAKPAPLTPAELVAFSKLLDQWDAFLVFAIKQAGGISNDPKFRNGLFDLLLDSRYRLVKALAHSETVGPDPVRLLFIDDWRRLGDLIRTAASHGQFGDRSLQFLSFVSAGDALFAFDQAAPALGVRISSEDLLRLAHIMAPQAKENPLAFSFEEDSELRKLFNVRAPAETLPPPHPSSSASPESPSATPTSSPPTPSITPSTSNSAISPGATPTALKDSFEPAQGFFAWLIGPENADAALGPSENATLQELGSRLSRVVVDRDNALRYRADIDRLLELTTAHEIGDKDVDSQYQPLYSRLVKAVAWQESCWRQFVRKGDRVVYLESSTHDIGLMQVNKYVWRGFYNIHKLEWDIIYNSDAGAEILTRMLADVAGKPGATSPGHPGQLARSTYAAYNGGPSDYRRWRGRESADKRLIDRSFWAKYRAIERGQKIDILSCAAEWGKTPGH